MRKLLCHLFGHRRYAGWWGDGLYGNVVYAGVDGIGREHVMIMSTCDRCGKKYTLARFHVDARSEPRHDQ